VLNGEKVWITNGGFADLFTLFAKVDGRRFTAFLVERSMGVKSGADEKKLGLEGSSTTALVLDDVRVPVENVLGTIGEGHRVAFNTLNLGRVKLGARNVASARLTMRQAVRYARERRQFGQAIAEFGLIKQKLAGSRAWPSGRSSAKRWRTVPWETSTAPSTGRSPAMGSGCCRCSRPSPSNARSTRSGPARRWRG
jgi:alkylation response protein AidB-like acyl-CoA dehydrogenase